MRECYAPVFVSNQPAFIYGNFDIPRSDLGGLTLSLVNDRFQFVSTNLASLNVFEVGGGLFHFWAKIETDPLPGYYYLILHSGDNVKFCTEHMIEFRKTPGKALKVQYRSHGVVNKFYYDLLPDFFNTLYLDLVPHRPQPSEAAAGHEDIYGTFVRTRTISKEYVTFATQWFDRGAHQAFAAMAGHKYLMIDEEPYARDESSEYEINWDDGGGMGYGFDIACGEMSLLRLTSVQENNDCLPEIQPEE